MAIIWSHWESGHGKGEHDGVGTHVKAAVRRLQARLSFSPITTTKQFFQFCAARLSEPAPATWRSHQQRRELAAREFVWVEGGAVQRPEQPAAFSGGEGMQQMRCFLSTGQQPGVVHMRLETCYCGPCSRGETVEQPQLCEHAGTLAPFKRARLVATADASAAAAAGDYECYEDFDGVDSGCEDEGAWAEEPEPVWVEGGGVLAVQPSEAGEEHALDEGFALFCAGGEPETVAAGGAFISGVQYEEGQRIVRGHWMGQSGLDPYAFEAEASGAVLYDEVWAEVRGQWAECRGRQVFWAGQLELAAAEAAVRVRLGTGAASRRG